MSWSITCQRESLFTFWPVHPLLLPLPPPPRLLLLNSTQSPSRLVFRLSLKLVLLPWLYWVGLPAQRNIVPPLTLLRLLIKEGSRCQRCSANWMVEKPRITEHEESSCKTEPPLALPPVCRFLSAAAGFWSCKLETFCRFKIDCRSSGKTGSLHHKSNL